MNPDPQHRFLLIQITFSIKAKSGSAALPLQYNLIQVDARPLPLPASGMLARFREHQRKASIYYAYHTIQRYTDEPFTSYMPEALFNISRDLLHELVKDHPKVTGDK